MKNKFFFPLTVLLLLLCFGCTTLYFEKPMPQGAETLAAFPSYLPGVYKIEEEAPGEGYETGESVIGEYVQEFLRFEPSGDTMMEVWSESRISVKDLPKVRAALVLAKKAGTILDFTMTDHLIHYTLSNISKDGINEQGGQYLTLNKAGDYYIIAQCTEVGYIFNLTQKTYTQFDGNGHETTKRDIYDAADSVETRNLIMVAKTSQNTLYFNLLDASNKWILICLVQVPPSGLLVLHSATIQEDTLKANWAYYNGITPFRKLDEDNYIINPDNKQLSALLADQKLFKLMRLRRVSSF